MAINPTLSSGLSNAPTTAPINGLNPNPASVSFVSAAGAQAQAQARMTQNGTIFTKTYSLQKPRYGFVIALAQFTGYTGLGGIGSTSIGQLVNNQGTSFKSNFLGTITLPLPAAQTMVDKQDVHFNEYQFGPGYGTVGNAIGPAVAQTLQTGQVPNNAGQNLIDSIPAAAGGIALGAGQKTPVVSEMINIGAAFGGMAVNQFRTVLLDGPTYKRYTFSFMLSPHNSQESTMIRDIIARLRKAAAPALGALNLFWDFPEIAQCVYIPQMDDVNTTYMYPFKPAVLTSVEASYAPNGVAPAFFSTTAPESVQLTLSFLEIEYWIAQNYS
jgi:hypothetical protein